VEAGRVIIGPTEVSEDEIAGHLKPVLRRADWRDLTAMQRLRLREEQVLETVRAKVAEAGLPMKVLRVRYNFEGSRLTVFFTAEGRVDFRELVRTLSRSLRTRVEMRQVGVRDEASLLEGIGRCGLTLCCATWLTEFPHVSIKTAKNQELPLSPSEISGLCGRLLCCLTYEDDQYTTIKGELPKVGTKLSFQDRSGVVTAHNVVKETATVTMEDGETFEVSLEDFRDLAERQKGR
jgi:cell fate regulator YaaT (PSP1 superfamily)